MTEIEILAYGSIILLFSSLLQGLTGFGFSLFAVPLLTLLLPPRTVIPVLIVYSLMVNVAVLISAKGHLDLKRQGLLLVGGLAGLPLGSYLLRNLPVFHLKMIIGAVVLLLAVILLVRPDTKIVKTDSKAVNLPVGFLSGLLCSSVSLSGPPVIIFYAFRKVNKQYFRGNLALFFLVLNFFTLILYSSSGMLTGVVLRYAWQFLPALLLGMSTGIYLTRFLPERSFQRVVLALLLIIGIMTVATNF
ncbi:MAG: sulfite exporter TauE/SafE family protein [Candidatus Cloacimonetes bacterium]|nr:sulfite exporter TauE/SafE family protein [Candidatus Cloacimonadota bacterium]